MVSGGRWRLAGDSRVRRSVRFVLVNVHDAEDEGDEEGVRAVERRDDHEGDRRERDKVDADEVDGPHVGDARTRGEVLHQLLSED